MPALLTPVPALERLVYSIRDRALHLAHGGGTFSKITESNSSRDHTRRRELVCLHVRRGDFEIDCPKYEAEARSKQVTGWANTISVVQV